MAANMAIIAITTKSSIRVKPDDGRRAHLASNTDRGVLPLPFRRGEGSLCSLLVVPSRCAHDRAIRVSIFGFISDFAIRISDFLTTLPEQFPAPESHISSHPAPEALGHWIWLEILQRFLELFWCGQHTCAVPKTIGPESHLNPLYLQ